MDTPCKHEKTTLNEDVGWDVDEEGETRFHDETCDICGAGRIVSDFQHFDGGDIEVFRGKWGLSTRELIRTLSERDRVAGLIGSVTDEDIIIELEDRGYTVEKQD